MASINLNKIFYYSAIVLFFLCLAASIKRDYENMQDGATVDLRKRIVGTRYQMKGYSPYFYKWHTGQSEELCNESESDSTLNQNVITLSPGYMWLLQPLAQMHFPAIERIWFVVQYIFFSTIFLFFFMKRKDILFRSILLLSAILFLLSRGWIYNMDIGQSYIIFPLLWAIPLTCFTKKNQQLLVTGMLLAICCWLRPLCVLFCISFLFNNDRKYFIKGFFLAGVVLALQVFFCTNQLQNWNDYFIAMKKWTDFYSQYDAKKLLQGIGPYFLEGEQFRKLTPLLDYQSNIPLNLNFIFGLILPKLIFIVVLSILIIIVLFILAKQKKFNSLVYAWLAGFVLYYLAEILIPVAKQSYYFVEFVFPVYLILINAKKLKHPLFIVMLLALFLAPYFFRMFPMQLLIGEYLLAATILVILLLPINKKNLLINDDSTTFQPI